MMGECFFRFAPLYEGFSDVLHLYYLPQYLPVTDELNQRGAQTVAVLYKQEDAVLNAAAEYAQRGS